MKGGALERLDVCCLPYAGVAVFFYYLLATTGRDVYFTHGRHTLYASDVVPHVLCYCMFGFCPNILDDA